MLVRIGVRFGRVAALNEGPGPPSCHLGVDGVVGVLDIGVGADIGELCLGYQLVLSKLPVVVGVVVVGGGRRCVVACIGGLQGVGNGTNHRVVGLKVGVWNKKTFFFEIISKNFV